MADIIPLAPFRFRNEIEAGYDLWGQYFNDEFDASTRLRDISSETLIVLAEPGDPGMRLIFGLITGFLGLSNRIDIKTLDADTQSRIIDIQLFLADHIHFEMMRRLTWLAFIPAETFPLFDMVTRFDQISRQCKVKPPQLASNHPGYPAYMAMISRDQQVFIRQLFPKALDAFKGGCETLR